MSGSSSLIGSLGLVIELALDPGVGRSPGISSNWQSGTRHVTKEIDFS